MAVPGRDLGRSPRSWSATYATRRALPAKYLVPGTLMLVLFVVYPIVLTAQTSFTNYGDGTRNDQGGDGRPDRRLLGGADADAPRYNLTVATDGTRSPPARSPSSWSPGRPGDRLQGHRGRPGGADAGDVTLENGRVTAADGYTILDTKQINAAADGARRVHGPDRERRDPSSARHQRRPSRARTTLEYDEDADTITDTTDRHRLHGAAAGRPRVLRRRGRQPRLRPVLEGQRRLRQLQEALHRHPDQQRLHQHLHLDLRLRDALGGRRRSCSGCCFAITLNDPRVRGQKIYRALLIMPYAIPGFISLLLWSSFYNQDFGLINDITGLDINWFGETWTRQVRRAAHQPVDGLPLHVPGAHRRPPGDPGGPHRGGQDRRRQRLRRASARSPSRCCW